MIYYYKTNDAYRKKKSKVSIFKRIFGKVFFSNFAKKKFTKH